MTRRNAFSLMFACGLLLSVYACKTTSNRSKVSAGGPINARGAWIQSPEAIERTLTTTWGLDLTPDERWRYIRSVYSFLGGTNVADMKVSFDKPNTMFVMAINSLSLFTAQRLLWKQTDMTANGKEYMFEGLGLSEPDTDCFKNDGKEWCDAIDGVTMTSLTQMNVKGSDLSKEWRKRLMHNIQDIGEFMLLNIDNTMTISDGTNRHAAQYLLEEIFIPALGPDPVTEERERIAWENTVHTMLLSGGFFLSVPPTTEARKQQVASFSSGDKALPIPDFANGQPGVLEKVLNPDKTESGVIAKVQLNVFITHPQKGQLRIDLTRGDKTVTVYQGSADAKRNFEDLQLTLSSDDNPLLQKFLNQPAGPWTARVYDNKPFEKGTVDGLNLTVEYGD